MGLATPGSMAIITANLRTNSGTLNLKEHLREVKVFESMMRPYRVIEMHVIDSTNFGNIVRIAGGEELSLVISNVYGERLDITAKAVKQTNDVMAAGLKASGSTITFADDSYFRNKTTKVQGSYQNIPGSSVIQEITSKYLGGSIGRLTASKGLIAEKQPYIISNKRPWDAIKQIRYNLTSTQFSKSGAYAYFRDKAGMVLQPLEQMFAEATPLGSFIQDATVGRSFLDIFRLESQIIAFQGGTSFGGGSMDPAESMKNESGVTHRYDFQEKKFNKGPVRGSPIPSIGTAFPLLNNLFGQIERSTHYIPHDPNLRQLSPEEEKGQGEKLLGHLAQSGGGYTMIVLFDRGINLTVGQGVHAKLASPRGDFTDAPFQQQRLGGKALVVNLCHHLKNFDTQPQGTTIVECSQGGFKQ